ncbi:MAG TPA: 50S ribosomal protein L11 methyltransferase [Candidatus Acidoferrum sp.]|jgi:protein arginine N-methyltransferase 1|nr:50S ribosomal protein L11 methyltransferase [Candidatus Acidoferrum sp.]
MYSLDEFGDMTADSLRFAAYSEAIQKAVRPGDIVVDLGCGPGIFALLACRAGAKRVYAIEAGEVIHFARQLAEANGFADRIEFFHDDSRKMQLAERANVIVSDVRGALPIFGDALPTIEDARERFLSEGGVQIPRRDTIYAAILETPDYYKRLVSTWKDVVRGLELTAALPMILNSVYKVRSQSHQLMTDAQLWCELDYTKHLNPRASAKLQLRTTRGGTAHGITAWFEAQLVEGIGFSTAPGTTGTIYGQGFFPWLEPVDLEIGQEIEVDLHADPVGGDYVWRWDTKIVAHKGQPERIFRQSTFLGAQFTSEGLRRRAVDFVPVLSESGLAERWILQAMDGCTPLEEIARAAVERFPGVFRVQDDAFRRISSLAEKFSR